ncbi:MAG: DUF4321 domain-containing protein [Lachnospiraceae bacterium]|nr:DUF4321 domain-containing protein [Lachnospiraceae bacterium]
MKLRGNFTLLILILAGIVVGSLLGNVLGQVSSLSWLSYGLNIGTPSPWQLNLGVMTLTFGISVNFTVASVFGVILGIIAYKKL